MKTLAKETEKLARAPEVRKAVNEMIEKEGTPSGDRSVVTIANPGAKDERVVIRRVEKT